MARTETSVPGIGCLCYEHPVPKAGESIAPMPGIDLPQQLPPHRKEDEKQDNMSWRKVKSTFLMVKHNIFGVLWQFIGKILYLCKRRIIYKIRKCPKGYIYDYDSPSGEHPLLFEISCRKTNWRKIYNIICTYIYNIPPFALHLKSSTRRQIVSM